MKHIKTIILFAIGILLSGCSASSKLNETTTKTNSVSYYDNIVIPFDSLKIRFEKGDGIVINGWLLLGPKTFFDYVSIDKSLFRGKQVTKNSSVIKYGYWGKKCNIFEIQIPDMDHLPYGDFLDVKACEFLIPNEQIFYFLNGAPCESYSTVLSRIKNYGIKNIQKVDAPGATKIWGTNYGKNGALIIDTNTKILAQYMFRPFDSTNIFSKIIKIDSIEYYSKRVIYKRMDKPSTIKKKKGVIKIPSGNSTIVFRDDTRDESFMEYKVIGQDTKYKWVLIQAHDWSQAYFYLVNQKLNKTDTLFEAPMIYGNKILCGQGGSSDGFPAYAEVWDINKGNLKRRLKFKWKSFGLDINEIYLSKDTLFIKNHKTKYLKMKI